MVLYSTMKLAPVCIKPHLRAQHHVQSLSRQHLGHNNRFCVIPCGQILFRLTTTES